MTCDQTTPVPHDRLSPDTPVRSMAGVVEVSLLLPVPWFNDLLDEADALGVSVGRLLRRLVTDHLAGGPFAEAGRPASAPDSENRA